MLNSLLWSGTDAIINAHDPMQNPGQTQIFYKLGKTHWTRTEHDPVDPDNPDDPTRFQPSFNPGPQILLTLYKKDVNTCGTARRNRKQFPKDLIKTKRKKQRG